MIPTHITPEAHDHNYACVLASAFMPHALRITYRGGCRQAKVQFHTIDEDINRVHAFL